MLTLVASIPESLPMTSAWSSCTCLLADDAKDLAGLMGQPQCELDLVLASGATPGVSDFRGLTGRTRPENRARWDPRGHQESGWEASTQ